MMAFGCKPKDHHATPVGDSFVVPEVADVVMYQVNPRVFAAENSFQAIINRLDSIQDLGVNMLWIMPIYPIGQEPREEQELTLLGEGLQGRGTRVWHGR